MRKTLLALTFTPLFWITPCIAQVSSADSVLNVADMDKTIDPCVDFYAYSCGGWIKNNPIPADQASWSISGKLEDDTRVQLRGILEEASKTDAPRDAVHQKIGDYYPSCMDVSAIDKLGSKPLLPELDRIAAIKSKKDLASYISTAQFPPSLDIGGPLFAFRSDQDYKDSSQVIAEIDQAGLGLPDRDYYFNNDPKSEEIRKAYLAHVAKMFELVGDPPKQASADAATVMRLETALAKGQMTRVERRDPPNLYHKMTTDELQKLTPSFDWTTYFAKTGAGPIISLNVVTPEYFRTLNNEITNQSLSDW